MKFVASHKINHAEKQTVIIAMHYVKEGGVGGKQERQTQRATA